MKYTLTKLNGNNYFNWRFKMQMLLTERGIWNVVTDAAPEPITDEWTKNNQKAHSIIALNIEDDQIQHIRTCLSAKDAWGNLKDFHEKDTANNRVAILRKLMTKRLEEDGDVILHVNEMNELFQKLLALGDTFKPEFILSATLIGSLPESYNGLAAILESRDEELTSSLVCSKIIDEYKRRKERQVQIPMHESVLKVTSSYNRRSRDEVVCFFCEKKGHYKQNCEEFKEYKRWLEKKQDRSDKVNMLIGEEDFLF